MKIRIEHSLVIAVGLVLFAATLRLLPHPANFAPVAAASIFGGTVLPRKYAAWLPVAAMAASDAVIGFYNIMPIVWACYAVIAVSASYLLKKRTAAKVLALTVAGSIFFFIVTNFAVWVWGGIYALNLKGLASCYFMALPFFRNTLASDLFYTVTLFGLYEIALRYWAKRAGDVSLVPKV